MIIILGIFITVSASAGRLFNKFVRGLGLCLDVCHDDWFDDVDIDEMMILYSDVNRKL